MVDDSIRHKRVNQFSQRWFGIGLYVFYSINNKNRNKSNLFR